MSFLKYGCIGVLVAGCGSVKGDDQPPPVDTAPTGFKIGGIVNGLGGGQGLKLQLDGANDLDIAADGSFEFPGTRDTGASYTVTIAGSPACPQRVCTISNGAGTIGGGDVVDIGVDCAEPKYRLVSQNWGEKSIRITDDLLALDNGDTATPRIVVGSNTAIQDSNIDSVAYDSGRDLVYAPASVGVAAPAVAIQVFANISTTTGNVAPARKITIAGETGYNGVDIDVANDRLYVSGTNNFYIFNNASALNGVQTPTATIPVTGGAGPLSLDTRANRLYMLSRSKSLLEFDNANALTSASVATHTTSWTDPNDNPFDLAIDSCRNRLYIGFRNSGNVANLNLFVFDAASTLNGAVSLTNTATARVGIPDLQIMNVRLDSSGHLYFWNDSAQKVNIINQPELLTGTPTVVPDKVINAVVERGYGLDVGAF